MTSGDARTSRSDRISPDEMLKRLRKYRLLPEPEIERIERDAMPQAEGTADLARRLMRAELLTEFQCDRILGGKAATLRLGSYVVQDRIGAGGMGEVYRAVHTRMERVVAVKVLPEQLVRDEAAVLRFQQEVKAAARLSHPNVVTAYDADESEGVYFLVMEYVQGVDLQEVVKKFGSLTAAEAVDCVLQAARGLEYAHGQGVLHRDIKPANLLFDAGGTVRLLDLGLARFDADASGEPDAAPLTQTGVIMGTVDYMSPEQADDSHTADSRSDIYSLGCTLHYLLTGRPPYSGETMLQRILAHRNQPQPDLPAEIPTAVNTVFRRMIARHPDDRFQSMSEVIAALEECRATEESLHDTDPLSRLTGITPAASPARIAPTSSPSRDTLNNTSHLQETVIPQPASSPPPRRRQRPWLIAALLLAAIIPTVVLLQPDAPMGTLLLEIDDPDAIGSEVSVDGARKITIRQQGQESIEVRANEPEHTLNVAKAGFETFTREFQVRTGDTRSIKVRLKPLERETAGAESPGEIPADTETRHALSFDGTTSEDRSVSIETLGYDGTHPITLEMWFAPLEPLDVALMSISGATNIKTWINQEFGMIGANVVTEKNWMNVVAQQSPEPIIKTMGRTHLAVTFDLKRACLFLNGECVATMYVGNFLPRSDSQPWNKISRVSLSRKFRGVTDEWRISKSVRYLDAFTPQEHFENDKQTLALYHFDEGHGSVLKDSSGNGHHGKIHGGTWVTLSRVTAGLKQSITQPPTEKDPPRWKPTPEQQAFFDRVKELPAEERVDAVRQKLIEINPGYRETLAPYFEDGHVIRLNVNFSPDLEVIWPIRAFPRLRSLHLGGPTRNRGKIRDLSSLTGLPLGYLGIFRQPVSDLSPLKGMPLKDLNLNSTLVSDLTPLTGMPLKKLVLPYASTLSDLTPLKDMALEELEVHYTSVSDLSPLKGLPLQTLGLDGTPVKELSPLEDMPLRELRLRGTSVTDLSPLNGMPLEYLALNHTSLSNLAPLKDVPLKYLELSNTPVNDLASLSGMPLEVLDLQHTTVTDLSPLKGMPLETLLLDFTAISDLSPLKGMSLKGLRLDHTDVSDLSPLKGIPLEFLGIVHTSIQDLSPLQNSSLKRLRTSIRLFGPEEKLLRSLDLESLSIASYPAELIPAKEFWQQFDARQQAAIDFANDTAQLPVNDQTAAVLARLKELNEHDIILETTIEDGVVAQASVGISRVQDDVQEDVRDEDLSPLRAFAHLRRLHVTGDGEFVDLSPLNIAPLETINCSRAIVVHNLPILRAMSSLKTINSKPASDYLDSVETELWPGREE